MASNPFKGIGSLVTDTDPAGNRKWSLGRLVALLSALVSLYLLLRHHIDPGTGVISLFAAAMVYNGFSKTPPAQGNGGEGIVAGAKALATSLRNSKQPEAPVKECSTSKEAEV